MARRKGRQTTNVSRLVPLGIAPGTIVDFGGTSAPDGWLMCDGASISKVTYAALYAVVGDANGSVDADHFNVPDKRGRAFRGSDDMGTSEGAASRDTFTRTAPTGGSATGVGSEQDSATKRPNTSFGGTSGGESQNHTHTFNMEDGGGWSTIPSHSDGGGGARTGTTNGNNRGHTHAVNITSGGDNETTVKNQAQNAIIKT